LVDGQIIAGGSGTVDGISAFDSSRSVYYYATDFVVPWIYQVDIKRDTILPPIDLPGAIGVEGLNTDPKRGVLFARYFDSNGIGYILNIQMPNGPVTTVATLSTNYHIGGWISASAYNPITQLYYLTANKNASTMNYNILAINTNSGNILNEIAISCKNMFPQRLYYDSNMLLLVGGGMSLNGEGYFAFWVDPMSGNCVSKPLQVESNGVVTSFAYDNGNSILYYQVATNTAAGGVLQSYNIVSGKQSKPVPMANAYTLESMEYPS